MLLLLFMLLVLVALSLDTPGWLHVQSECDLRNGSEGLKYSEKECH